MRQYIVDVRNGFMALELAESDRFFFQNTVFPHQWNDLKDVVPPAVVISLALCQIAAVKDSSFSCIVCGQSEFDQFVLLQFELAEDPLQSLQMIHSCGDVLFRIKKVVYPIRIAGLRHYLHESLRTSWRT